MNAAQRKAKRVAHQDQAKRSADTARLPSVEVHHNPDGSVRTSVYHPTPAQRETERQRKNAADTEE